MQFGVKKCKSILILRGTGFICNQSLAVDNWSTDYIENENSVSVEILEQYTGKVKVEKVTEQKYLGLIICSRGNSMENINIKNKSIGTIIQIFSQLELSNFYQ